MIFVTGGIIILVISFAIALLSLIREQRLGKYGLEVVEEEGKPLPPESRALELQAPGPRLEEVLQEPLSKPEYTESSEPLFQQDYSTEQGPVFSQSDYQEEAPVKQDNFAFEPVESNNNENVSAYNELSSISENTFEDDQVAEDTRQFFTQDQPNLQGEFSLASLRKGE